MIINTIMIITNHDEKKDCIVFTMREGLDGVPETGL
jgi:hypothetical protein